MTRRNASHQHEVQVPASRERESSERRTEQPSDSQNMLVRRRAPDATVPRVPSEHQSFKFRF